MKFIDQGINWKVATKKGKNIELLTVSSVGRAFWHIWKKSGRKFGLLCTNAYRQFENHRDFPAKVINDLCASIKSTERKQQGSILKMFIVHEKILKKLHAFDERIVKIDFTKYSNTELAKIFCRSQFLHGSSVWYAYNPYFLQYLGDELYRIIRSKTKDTRRQAEYFEILSAAKCFSLMQAEQLDLLMLARRLKIKQLKFNNNAFNEPIPQRPLSAGYLALQGQDLATLVSRDMRVLICTRSEMKNGVFNFARSLDNKIISNHLKKYGFFGYYYLRGRPWTVADLLNRISAKQKEPLEKINADTVKLTNLKKYVSEWPKLAKVLKLTQSQLIFVRTIKQMTYVLNLYEEVANFHGYAVTGLFGEIARRIGVRPNQLIEMDVEEITIPLSRGEKISAKLKARINERKKDSLFLMVNRQIQILESENLEIYRKLQKSAKIFSRKELIGQSASNGVAKGKVALVCGIGDLHKVKKGYILVAMNTIPSFVPAMERAAAIVTEVGGLLSHAAIVARELGVPCVVGADGAMTVFKDGDEVEVNAEKGKVRKL